MTSSSSWPVVSLSETLARLTAPGAPFEMTLVEAHGRMVRAYVKAKPDLRCVLDESRRFGDRDFLRFEDERLSFEHHWRAAHAFARALQGTLGVGKGDRVAIGMRNYPEWSICAWGALAAGAVIVPLNAWERGASLARMVRNSGAKAAVVDPERLERLSSDMQPGEVEVIVARQEGPAAPGARSLSEIIGPPADYGRLPDEPAADPGLQPDDLATIFYTSGTTGHAKGAFGSHRNVTTNLVNLGFRPARAAVRRGESWPVPAAVPPPRAQLLPLPFFHVTGFHSTLVPALANGVTLRLMYRWDPEAALDLIERERLNALTLVPSQAWQLIDAAEGAGRDLGAVDTVGYGGAAAAPELAARARNTFPAAFPSQGYGATETSSLAAANSHEDMMAHPGSVGIALPCCDLRVVADDEGHEAPRGEAGELWVYGPNVVLGYWDAPEATAAAFVDGWYRTGDIARMDDEGFVTILDRSKDMLIRGGENIYCIEIENVLASHPDVAEAAVVGVPDRVMGELVGAAVRLRPGAKADAEALKSHVAARLAAHKTPVVVQLRDEPLPRNPAGKALKSELRRDLLAMLDPA